MSKMGLRKTVFVSARVLKESGIIRQLVVVERYTPCEFIVI